MAYLYTGMTSSTTLSSLSHLAALRDQYLAELRSRGVEDPHAYLRWDEDARTVIFKLDPTLTGPEQMAAWQAAGTPPWRTWSVHTIARHHYLYSAVTRVVPATFALAYLDAAAEAWDAHLRAYGLDGRFVERQTYGVVLHWPPQVLADGDEACARWSARARWPWQTVTVHGA